MCWLLFRPDIQRPLGLILNSLRSRGAAIAVRLETCRPEEAVDADRFFGRGAQGLSPLRSRLVGRDDRGFRDARGL